MNKVALKALKGSIKKWQNIVEGTRVDNGTNNCPLCVEFYAIDHNDEEPENCNGCPVAKKAGPGCVNSPYTIWANMHILDGYNFPYKNENKTHTKFAKAELEFLKSFLPKKRKVKK